MANGRRVFWSGRVCQMLVGMGEVEAARAKGLAGLQTLGAPPPGAGPRRQPSLAACLPILCLRPPQVSPRQASLLSDILTFTHQMALPANLAGNLTSWHPILLQLQTFYSICALSAPRILPGVEPASRQYSDMPCCACRVAGVTPV